MKKSTEYNSLLPNNKSRTQLVSNISFFKKGFIVSSSLAMTLAVINISLLATEQIDYSDDNHRAADNFFVASILFNIGSIGFSIYSGVKKKLSEKALINFDNSNPQNLDDKTTSLSV